ncbi:MAG TPA: zinc-binding alcohol dehydrogenase family protein [Burkholderiales bacterium]|nr:zinc-binding alcohol dehydrogenase family protein [Burkholderiales bacterium]
MKAAIVTAAGKTPVFGDFREPRAGAGETLITVGAAALSHLAKNRAGGTHYSAGSEFPADGAFPTFVAGVDGVGRREDGSRVYFILPSAPFGSMAEQTVVPAAQCVAVPDALDDASAAALALPAMSSWAALRERVGFVKGETVLVHGATGASGRLAVQVAKYLGAKKVVATGRDPQALARLSALGGDVVISLGQEEAALDAAYREQFSAGIDVVLDYVWGPSAERILGAAAKAGKPGLPIRFAQIGSTGGAAISLPAAVLRSSGLVMMGSGLGSIALDRLLHAVGEVLAASAPGGFAIATRSLPLAQVQSAWSVEGRVRTVFVTGA